MTDQRQTPFSSSLCPHDGHVPFPVTVEKYLWLNTVYVIFGLIMSTHAIHTHNNNNHVIPLEREGLGMERGDLPPVCRGCLPHFLTLSKAVHEKC
jgi:hypothetical protein